MKNRGSFFSRVAITFLFAILLVSLPSAKKRSNKKPRVLHLTSVHIVDRNGFSETISAKERLNQFQNVDFLAPQPYQKVLRIYSRDSQGNIRSVVTTYHENGNPKQFLEILNARANGRYCEWHENGKMSLFSKVISGSPDVTSLAERSWLFDDTSYVWDQNENLIAEIPYSQGSLNGISSYFHQDGEMWKRLPYVKNELEGVVEIYKKGGELLQQTTYSAGIKDGSSLRYWDCGKVASEEEYYRGKLESGTYYDKDGTMIAEVKKGTGLRAIFGKDRVQELQEFVDGMLEGKIQVFNSEGCLKKIYHVKNGVKHGEEIEYYDRFFQTSDLPQPKLSFYWYEGKIQGIAKTWYNSGAPESQKEMANNKRNGVLTAWYRNGNLMLMEEYENDKLLRGDYFKREERLPVSQVSDGKGTAMIFDAEGHFIQKIIYANGQPEQ